MAGGSLIQELLEGGFIDDVTGVILPKRDIKALPSRWTDSRGGEHPHARAHIQRVRGIWGTAQKYVVARRHVVFADYALSEL